MGRRARPGNRRLGSGSKIRRRGRVASRVGAESGRFFVTDFPLVSHLSPFVYLLFDAYGNWSVRIVTIHVYKPMSKSSKP